jgi:chromate transporter
MPMIEWMAKRRPRGAVAEVALVFSMLGLVAFGGPAAHVALMRRELVVRRKWLTDDEFLRMFAACNLIPGPSSTELAIYIGYRRAGWRGLVLGGVLFILPAMLIMLVIAWAYDRYGAGAQALGILYGIRAAVVGIILWAIIDLGRRLLKRWTLVILAAGVAGLSLIGINPVLLIVAGGLVMSAASQVGSKPKAGMLALTSGLALPAWSGGKLLTVFLTFLKLGLVSFGSGYVLYAFLHADFVQGLHWLTDQQLIDAIAIGQATPGPVFTTATFLGYLFAGVPGALLATVAIFLPGFVLVPLLDRIVRLTQSRASAQGFVDGANAAALGLIAAVTMQVGRSALVDPITVMIALVALGVIWKWPLASPGVVLAAAVVGVARLAIS